MSTARDEILRRIAAAHTAAPPPPLAYADIERGYLTGGEATGEALAEVLVDRLRDYKALVRRVERTQLPAAVAAALTARGVARLVVPDGLPPAWLAETTVDVLRDGEGHRLGVDDLDGADGVLTGCAVAMAETGTLVLDASPDQGRRALTLVPDYHLCVVLPESVCDDVPAGLARLDVTRPLTWVSGPSATSDIELERVEGVHGPRTLEVIVVHDTQD
ncbi:MAG: hypothetical protein JWP61_259 [Friedmanniella sp.]|nr:hypothetical protein [Friedmanniella sp.]